MNPKLRQSEVNALVLEHVVHLLPGSCEEIVRHTHTHSLTLRQQQCNKHMERVEPRNSTWVGLFIFFFIFIYLFIYFCSLLLCFCICCLSLCVVDFLFCSISPFQSWRSCSEGWFYSLLESSCATHIPIVASQDNRKRDCLLHHSINVRAFRLVILIPLLSSLLFDLHYCSLSFFCHTLFLLRLIF